MIENLARCPYCGDCEIALDDSLALLFDPNGLARPCQHLAWVDGRYSQWDVSAQGIDHVIGSTEFRWAPPIPGMAERIDVLLPFLKELVNQGPKWVYAPIIPFVLRLLSAEEKVSDEHGPSHLVWDV